MRIWLAGTAVLVLAVLTGCGSEADPTAGSDETSNTANTSADATPSSVSSIGPDPVDAGMVCGLVSAEEVSEIVGNPVVGVDIDPTLCEYAPVNGDPGADGTGVDVFLNDALEETCDLEFGLVGGADQQGVEGLDAVAYWKAASAQLYVCTGEKFLTITQYKPPAVSDDEASERAQRIAKRVLENV